MFSCSRCACVRSYYVTHAEAQLLNDINFNHSNYQFGRVMFTERDLIVTLRDAEELLKFLDACYVRILKGDKDSLERFAFIRINRESAVPFTLHNNEKCLPLFYFEGEIDNLNLQARKLEGWDLAYLKFCCRIQGIKRELYDYDTCPVVSLREIENYFPPDTVFDCHWPSKVDTTPLLVRGRNQMPSGQWAKPPAAAPFKS